MPKEWEKAIGQKKKPLHREKQQDLHKVSQQTD
jgi:hypothetical protein